MRCDNKIVRIAEKVLEGADGERYIWDPDHAMRASDLPAGEHWHKTDRGWSSVEQGGAEEGTSQPDIAQVKETYQKQIFGSVGSDNSYVKEGIGESMKQLEMALDVSDAPYPDVATVKPPIPKDKKIAERRLKRVKDMVKNMFGENLK